MRKFGNGIDLLRTQIANAIAQNLATAPTAPTAGLFYFDTTLGRFLVHNGTAFGLSTTDRLDQIAKPTNTVDMNGQILTGLGAPQAANDAAPKGYVDTALANALANISYKDPKRAATTAALPAYNATAQTLTATSNGAFPSTASDGLTLALNDTLLVKNETGSLAANNGVWQLTTVGTASTPWVLTRSADANTAAKLKSGVVVPVNEGTLNQDTLWLLITDGNYTLGTTQLTWKPYAAGMTYTASNGVKMVGNDVQANPAANGGIVVTGGALAVDRSLVPNKATATIGDGSATSIAVTHNLGTQDVVVSIRDASTNAVVDTDWTATSANVVTFTFQTAPAANAYKVVVIG